MVGSSADIVDAVERFFNSPELVAHMFEISNLSTKNLFACQRVNKFIYAVIAGSPSLQRRMGVRYVAGADIPATQVERHNMIAAHLLKFLLNPAVFELRPYVLVPDQTYLGTGRDETLRISFHRDALAARWITRRGLSIGPLSQVKCSRSYDDHEKHVFALSDTVWQSWQDILLTPFPVTVELEVLDTDEVDLVTVSAKRRATISRCRQFKIRFEKDARWKVGDLVRLLEKGRSGTWSERS